MHHIMAGALVDLGWDGTAFKSDFLLMVSLVCETFWLHDYGVGLFRVFFDFPFFLQGTGLLDELVRNMDMIR